MTDTISAVSDVDFRRGMSLLAGAVTIVTTDGPAGRQGFTASAVCSVTDRPPTLLVCVNLGSSVGKVFSENHAVCVNLIQPDQTGLAMLFGGKTPAETRFSAAKWSSGVTGAPVLEGALASFDCTVRDHHDVGTHRMLFCTIHEVRTRSELPGSVYFNRRFHAVSS